MRQGRPLLLAGLLLLARPASTQTHPSPTSPTGLPTDTLRISLADVWQRADVHSRVVTIKRQAVAGRHLRRA